MLISFLALMFFSLPSFAAHFRVIEPPDYPGSDYEVVLLEIALALADGNHTLERVPNPSGVDYNQSRAFRQFADGNAVYNVTYSGYDLTRESELRMIYIPLTRGLLGRRVLFIREKSRAIVASAQTLTQLTRLVSIGVPIGHPERAIFEDAGFKVMSVPGKARWTLLARGRFTALLFGVDEMTPLMAAFGGKRDGATIEVSPDVMISFPYDSFFFVGPADTELADIIEQGLKRAYDSGAFMQHFCAHPSIRGGLEDAAHHPRRDFAIANSYISEKVKAIPARYWHSFDSHNTPADQTCGF